jgi:CHAT domain-containing protein/tetratricopeptide (TPR) repeat protein
MGQMRTLVVWILFSTCLVPGSLTADSPAPADILAHQQELMQRVTAYRGKKPVQRYIQDLEEIYEIYKQAGNRESTRAFYADLLKAYKYKSLYPYAFYYLSRFYAGKARENYLLKGLKYSLEPRARDFSLSRLYEYYRSAGIDSLAFSYLQRLIDLRRKRHDNRGLEQGYRTLAAYYRRRQDLLAALDHDFKALEYSKKNPDNRGGYIYLDIAEIFALIDKRELSRKYLKKAIDFSTRKGDLPLKILVLSAYSQLYYRAGDYPQALKYIDLCIDTALKSDRRDRLPQAYYQKALVLKNMGQSGSERRFLQSAVEAGLEHRQYRNLLPVLAAYAEQCIADAQFPEAERLMATIDDIYAPYFPHYFFYYYLQARLREKRGERSAALTYYERTAERLNRYLSGFYSRGGYAYQEEISHIYEKIIAFFLRMYDLTGDQTHIKKALYFGEMKNAAHNEPLPFKDRRYIHFAAEREKLEQEFLSYHNRLMAALDDDDRAEEVKFCEKKLARLRKQYAELTEFINAIPIRYRQYDFQDFNIDLIQRKLNPRQLVVKFCFLQDDLYIFFLSRRDLGYLCLQQQSPEVLHQVKTLTRPLDDFSGGTVDYLRVHYDLDLAHRLYRRLLSGILDNHPRVDELLIVSEKELFTLPFEALVTGFNRQPIQPGIVFSEYRAADYLVQRCAVSYYFSLFHLQKRFRRREPEELPVAAFGHPPDPGKTGVMANLRIRELLEFENIPSARDEILRIREIFGPQECKIFLDEDFNRDNFETFAPTAGIIHIASHFVHNPAYPNQSALLLAGRQARSPLYYAHEIFRLRLNAQLVVLSGCESSEKSLLGFQGLVGMIAAFRQAGARAMMVSLWPVDELSSRLIPLFYREYRQVDDFALALRGAKLTLMTRTATLKDNTRVSFAHPFLWSNYILYQFYL